MKTINELQDEIIEEFNDFDEQSEDISKILEKIELPFWAVLFLFIIRF